ncbi:MAG: aldehyde ferredoxin oxidoreductase N-terminal domain-containing protein, partial [Anaerolineales bacterium]
MKWRCLGIIHLFIHPGNNVRPSPEKYSGISVIRSKEDKMWILRVNMNDQSYRVEKLPKAYKYLAGRALTSTIVAKEVPPLCHPLGP